MITHEYLKNEIDNLPEVALEKIYDFIKYQRFTLGLYDNETDYLMSVPGMTDKIKEGLKTPLSECVPLSDVWNHV